MINSQKDDQKMDGAPERQKGPRVPLWEATVGAQVENLSPAIIRELSPLYSSSFPLAPGLQDRTISVSWSGEGTGMLLILAKLRLMSLNVLFLVSGRTT
ncbi:hypothetical protein EYF80_045121 [Liparis tanakae]|uniref:Uncharacterized protein n=1 Tax=Liparis tanakae TaxID=230148 RepID=A0A4Z2FWG9_9TELE|nr:hypothetical protein EYF80_045121 [Liparis tanakae]